MTQGGFFRLAGTVPAPPRAKPAEWNGGFFERRTISPTSLAVVIAMHAAALGALAMSKGYVFDGVRPKPIKVSFITDPPPPPPANIEEPVNTPPTRPTDITYREPVVKVPAPNTLNVTPRETADPPKLGDFDGPVIRDLPPQAKAEPLPKPTPPPVRFEARSDPRFADRLQPPYPASEERLGNEGTVVVRVTIGTDGRVTAVQKVRATSDAFFRATQQHALSTWRFIPATEDREPVETTQQLTVRFELKG
jgi:periplasmic protein TonB